MTKIKTIDLIGPALDWAVAMCEGMKEDRVHGRGAVRIERGLWRIEGHTTQDYILSHDYHRMIKECEGPPFFNHTRVWEPSTSWAQAGPIIQRERIDLLHHANGAVSAISRRALAQSGDMPPIGLSSFGPNALVAAMRMHVTGTLGECVDVPDDVAAVPPLGPWSPDWIAKAMELGDPEGCAGCGAIAGCCPAYPNCPGGEMY